MLKWCPLLTSVLLAGVLLVGCGDDPAPPIAPGMATPGAATAPNAAPPQNMAPSNAVISCNGVMGMCVECTANAPCAQRVRAESCQAGNGVFSDQPCPRAGATGMCTNAGQGNRAILYPPNWQETNGRIWCQNPSGFSGVWGPAQ